MSLLGFDYGQLSDEEDEQGGGLKRAREDEAKAQANTVAQEEPPAKKARAEGPTEHAAKVRLPSSPSASSLPCPRPRPSLLFSSWLISTRIP